MCHGFRRTWAQNKYEPWTTVKVYINQGEGALNTDARGGHLRTLRPTAPYMTCSQKFGLLSFATNMKVLIHHPPLPVVRSIGK